MGATRGGDFLQRKKYGRLPIYTVHGNTLHPQGANIICTLCHRGERARRRRIIRPQDGTRASLLDVTGTSDTFAPPVGSVD